MEYANNVKECIERLRKCASNESDMIHVPHLVRSILFDAANTIEVLCEKLDYMNCCGEWMYCGDGHVNPPDSGKYRVIVDDYDIFKEYEFDEKANMWYDEHGNEKKVIAWWRECAFEI